MRPSALRHVLLVVEVLAAYGRARDLSQPV